MICKINLEGFKAFGNSVEFKLEDNRGNQGKNMLAYGENGSGKTSLFEALRLFFYQERMLDSLHKEGEAEEMFEANKKSFLRGYNNKTRNVDFTLTVNGLDRSAFPFMDYACYILGSEDVHLGDHLLMKDWLQDRFIPAFDITAFWNDKGQILVENVNKAIKDDFREQFTIATADKDTTLKVVDSSRGVSPEKDYRQFLNEAKLHLVALLLFFETVRLHKSVLNENVDKVLVLDDIVTSLDATNRIFLVNYLARYFQDCQLILLTHNVGFFNLVKCRIGENVDNNAFKWVLYNICEIGNNTDAFLYREQSSSDIAKEYEKLANTDPVRAAEEAGNKIRKRFEVVMYEYAKLIQMDEFEDANQILKRLIVEQKPLFMKYDVQSKKTLWPSDLLDEIINVMDTTKSPSDRLADISKHVKEYKRDYSDMEKLVEFLKEMKMFQKVVLHQLSHGSNGRPGFTKKEIDYSLALLKRFESLVKNAKGHVRGM